MPAWRVADSREGKCLESLLDKIILKVSCSRFNSDEKEYLSIRVTDFNRKPNNSKREMGWNKNPRADMKRHSFLRDADQEGRPVVELPCRTASRTTQRLPSEHPGNTVPNPCDSMHKSQNYNSPWSPGLPTAKAKSQAHSQSHRICSQTFEGHGLLVWFGNGWERMISIVYRQQFFPLGHTL